MIVNLVPYVDFLHVIIMTLKLWPIKIWPHYRNLEFDQLYCIHSLLANDVFLVCTIVLVYEEALQPKKLEISHVSQIWQTINRFWFFLTYLISHTTVSVRAYLPRAVKLPWSCHLGYKVKPTQIFCLISYPAARFAVKKDCFHVRLNSKMTAFARKRVLAIL